jgi:hypothetical protein
MAYSTLEQRYLDNLIAVQYPDPPPEAAPAQDASQMPLGTGPGDIQLASAADPRGTISAAPRNPIMGGVADFVRGVRTLANQYEIKEFVPLLGGMGVGDLLVGKSPEELEQWAYGNSPITMPPSGTGGYIPIVKTGRKEQLLDTMFLGMDAVGLGKSAGVAGRAAVKKLGPKAADMLVTTVKNQGFPIEGLNIVESGPGAPAVPVKPVQLTRQEKAVISVGAGGKKDIRTEATALATELKNNYPMADGWTPIEISTVKPEYNKDGKYIKVEVEPKAIAYDFHTPPDGVPVEAWQATLSSRVLDEVQTVVDRAAAGDKDALNILAEASWYRTMRDRLRTEFGGIGDVFADVLGTTSAQTDVRQNFKNAVTVLRKFSRGDYDKTLAAYESRVAKGQPVDAKTLSALDKAGEFELIKNDAGKLFNTNSPATMGALLDLFRAIKAGDAPKTPNFTGNLIGLTSEATIDVWAARMLRRVADLPRIPPPAEKGVGGLHQTGSTLFNPNVGGEFGFGQDVFREAADEINKSGIIKNIAPDIGDLGPDDLQAVAWFIEKERWTKNGWTSKAGEGGSLDYEMSFAGTADQARVSELRKGINASFKAPARRVGEKLEGGETAYQERIAPKREQDLANKEEMRKELLASKANVDRYTLGISGERPGKPMSNYAQAELAAEHDDVVRNNPAVLSYNLSNTYGSFMGQTERALNAEFVTRQNFDPAPLERRMIEQGKAYDQDAVFISKVVKNGTVPNARPGVEIYFKEKVTPEKMAAVTEKLRAYGVDGFTYVTDMRFSDRIAIQARAGGAETAGLNGLRFQYIPEFDDAYTVANRSQIMAEKQRLFDKVVTDIIDNGNVSDARLVWYDTKVHFRSDYDAYLGRNAEGAGTTPGQGSSSGANAAKPNNSGEVGQDFSRTVSDRLRKKASGAKRPAINRGNSAPLPGAE